MLTPNEYHHQEVLSGAQQRVSASFRLQLGIDNGMREFARQHKADISIVWRQAAAEYLRARGIDPLLGS